MTLPSRFRLPRDAADFSRGLRSRLLWSAAVRACPPWRAALHSFRLSTPPRRSGPGVAASVRRPPYAMSDSSASAVILSERSDAKDLYLPRLAPFSPNRASRGGASIPCSHFSN